MTLKCHPSGPQRQQVWLVVAIVILCTQLQVAVMTRKGTQQAQPKVQWNPIEIDSFLTYLISVKSAMAGTSFKKVTYNEAVKYIESLRTVGPVKTGAHCMNKWGMLKQIYNAIESYRHHKSGCHWDNEHGANIEGPAAEAVWEEYVSRKPNFPMKSFKNCGWPYHSKMEEILPHHSSTRGVAAYNPASSSSNEPPPAASTSSAPYGTDNSMSDVNRDGNPNDSGVGAMYQHQFIPLIPSMAQPEISWGVPPPPNPAFEDYGSSTMAAPPTMSSRASTSALSAPTMSAPYKSLPVMFAPMSAPMSAPPMSAPMSAPAKSAPMSSGSSAGNSPFDHLHFGLTIDEAGIGEEAKAVNNKWQDTPKRCHEHSVHSPAEAQFTDASKKTTVQDTANTAVLMNLQGTINRLSDSLNTSFSASEETHVADSRSRALKSMQSEPELSKEDKVVAINIFMNSPAACDTFNDIEDPELCMAFLHSIIARAKQENPMM
ncbi:hypothetical protein EDB19DRAFT_1903020 [Suillus lakei]|nr:hypothetical protein EDB19DRAFT_1903020 [Suillus lakei]